MFSVVIEQADAPTAISFPFLPNDTTGFPKEAFPKFEPEIVNVPPIVLDMLAPVIDGAAYFMVWDELEITVETPIVASLPNCTSTLKSFPTPTTVLHYNF